MNDNNRQSSSNVALLPNDPSITITNNPLTTNTPAGPLSNSSSTHSIFTNINEDENPSRKSTATGQLITNLGTINTNPSPSRSTNSLFAKLTDAKKSLFGRSTTPDPFFTSAIESRALLSYILDQPEPQLDVIQELERNGAQLNAITDEGNTSIHVLARTDNRSTECIQIVDYFIKKGCDPNRQNDYGWTAGLKIFLDQSSMHVSSF